MCFLTLDSMTRSCEVFSCIAYQCASFIVTIRLKIQILAEFFLKALKFLVLERKKYIIKDKGGCTYWF